MNSDVILIACASEAMRRLDRASRWLAAFETRFSRFQPLSELSRLNASAGKPFRASPLLFSLVKMALDFAQRSEGLFSPTLLRELELAGYNRSFDLPPVVPGRKPLQTQATASWRNVALDSTHCTIMLPEGTGIDLGGIGKGWAVDRLGAMLGSPSLVDGGGDIYARGQPPDGLAWFIGVADPFNPDKDVYVLKVVDKGIATSSSLRRRWRADGTYLHHIIDPRTGRPSQSDAVQVTTIAPSAVLTEYHAKVALLMGARRGLDYLDQEPDVEGIVFRQDGAVGLSRHIGDYFQHTTTST